MSSENGSATFAQESSGHPEVTREESDRWRAEFLQHPVRPVTARAFSSTSIYEATYDSRSAASREPVFDVEISSGPVTAQRHSGRCWLFASANLIRNAVVEELSLGDFEVSQNYFSFWDKFEKANFLLNSVIELRDRPVDDRLLQWVLDTGVNDGGQWDLYVNILRKYGAVPKSAYPDTYQSGETRLSNRLLNLRLRRGAGELRAAWADSARVGQLHEVRNRILQDVYAILTASYGVVPDHFDWEVRDRDGQYRVFRDLTPQTFAERFVSLGTDDYVQLINAPQSSKPFGRRYTVDYLQNVIEGRPISYLNVPIDVLTDAAVQQLRTGQQVWFGADVAQFGDRKRGFWDDGAFRIDDALDVDLTLDKGEQLDLRASQPNHAMVFTGVAFGADGRPTRWKVKNSWGKEAGADGYFVISQSWFERFVYQTVIRREFIPAEYLRAFEEEVVHLDPWDPLGALAG